MIIRKSDILAVPTAGSSSAAREYMGGGGQWGQIKKSDEFIFIPH